MRLPLHEYTYLHRIFCALFSFGVSSLAGTPFIFESRLVIRCTLARERFLRYVLVL